MKRRCMARYRLFASAGVPSAVAGWLRCTARMASTTSMARADVDFVVDRWCFTVVFAPGDRRRAQRAARSAAFVGRRSPPTAEGSMVPWSDSLGGATVRSDREVDGFDRPQCFVERGLRT